MQNCTERPQELPRSSITFSQGSEISIMFDDPFFAQAELVYYDYAQGSVNAILDGATICIGHLPLDIADDVSSDMRLCLTAMNEEGNMVVLDTRIQCFH